MAGLSAGYDLSVSTFSPDGRIFQVEYACKAVDNSATSIAISCKDGVIVGVEKQLKSKMLLESSVRRIYCVDKHICMSITGLLSDGRQILNEAYHECTNYKKYYGENIPVKILADRLSLFIHAHTLYGFMRPFGVGILLCGIDPPYDVDEASFFSSDFSFINNCSNDDFEKSENINNDQQINRKIARLYNIENYNSIIPVGLRDNIIISDDKVFNALKSEIYYLDPSGINYKYKRMSFGKGKQIAKTEIEKLDLPDLTCKDALFHLCKIFHLISDDYSTVSVSKDQSDDCASNFELAWISKDSNYVFQYIPNHLVIEANLKAAQQLKELDNI